MPDPSQFDTSVLSPEDQAKFLLSDEQRQSLSSDQQTTDETTEQGPEFKYQFMIDPQKRHLLAERIDQLVEKSCSNETKNLIFLDKSARPLATLFKDLWIAKNPELEAPSISFINIGKEISNQNVTKQMDKNKLASYDQKERLRYISKNHGEELEEALGLAQGELDVLRQNYQHLREAEQQGHDGKKSKAVIVDEYTYSGDSLTVAKKIIHAAFPNIQLEEYSVSNRNDDLFDYIDTHGEAQHDPPWRAWANRKPWLEGVSGVVDPKGPDSSTKLTAEPYYKFNEADRFNIIEDKVSKIQSNFQHSGPRTRFRGPSEILEAVNELDDFTHTISLAEKEKGTDFAIDEVFNNSMRLSLEKIKQDLLLYYEIEDRLVESAKKNDPQVEFSQIHMELGKVAQSLKNQLDEFVGVEIDPRNWPKIYDFIHEKYFESLNMRYDPSKYKAIQEPLKKLAEFLESVYGINEDDWVINDSKTNELYLLGPDATRIQPYVKQLREEMHSIAREYLESVEDKV